MELEVLDVTDYTVVIGWEAYHMTVRYDFPITAMYFGGNTYYRPPPKAVKSACYKLGYGILANRKKRKLSARAKLSSFVNDLFTIKKED